ncbi:MAG: hypothetical protein AAGK05_13860, partial [Pseudomonadota bacterium]
ITSFSGLFKADSVLFMAGLGVVEHECRQKLVKMNMALRFRLDTIQPCLSNLRLPHKYLKQLPTNFKYNPN